MGKLQLERRILWSILLAACLFGALASSVYWSRVAAETTITEQSFIETASYTFWKDGSTCYSKNVETGVIRSGSNAETLINSALTASDGIFFLSGNNFTISAVLTLDSGDYLIGSGKATILFLASNSDAPAIYSENSENIKVSDLSIDGNKVGQNGGMGLSGVRFSGVRNFNLENLYIQNTYHQGLDIVAFSHDGFIGNIETYRTGAAGIYIGYQSYNIVIDRAVLLESGLGAGGSGIDEDGLIIAGETTSYCKNITLNNIYASNASRYGISFWDCEYVTGTNIYATNNAEHGIYFVRGNHYFDLKNVQANYNNKIGVAIYAGDQIFKDDESNHHITIQGYSIGNGEEGVKLGGFLPTNNYPYPHEIDLSVNALNNTYTGISIAGYNSTYRIEHVRIHDCRVAYNSQNGTGQYNGILLYQTKYCQVDNVEIKGSNHAWGLYENAGTGGYNTVTSVNAWEGDAGGIGLNDVTSKAASSYNLTSWISLE